jgi:soluble lytic murein transglycosylase-like protein
MKYGCLLTTALLIFSGSVNAITVNEIISRYDYGTCLVKTAQDYRISPVLIDAIIKAESNHQPQAININTSGSEDVGLMQINSQWLPQIKPLGYDRNSLFDPCTNIQVGTWILAQEIARFGYTWTAVGAYNAGPSKARAQRRSRYALRVFSHIDQ